MSRIGTGALCTILDSSRASAGLFLNKFIPFISISLLGLCRDSVERKLTTLAVHHAGMHTHHISTAQHDLHGRLVRSCELGIHSSRQGIVVRT